MLFFNDEDCIKIYNNRHKTSSDYGGLYISLSVLILYAIGYFNIKLLVLFYLASVIPLSIMMYFANKDEYHNESRSRSLFQFMTNNSDAVFISIISPFVFLYVLYDFIRYNVILRGKELSNK